MRREKSGNQELTVVKVDLRVRQKRDANGYLPLWEVISVTMYSDRTVQRIVLCTRASEQATLQVIRGIA